MSEAPSSLQPDLWAGLQEGDSVAAVNPEHEVNCSG
jgi:hypothetical protein